MRYAAIAFSHALCVLAGVSGGVFAAITASRSQPMTWASPRLYSAKKLFIGIADGESSLCDGDGQAYKFELSEDTGTYALQRKMKTDPAPPPGEDGLSVIMPLVPVKCMER